MLPVSCCRSTQRTGTARPMVRALFHEFVVPIQAIPVAGLSNQAMKTAYYFKISWSGRPEQTVTIMAFNAKRALNDSFTLPAWERKAFQRGLLQADPHGFSGTARAGLCALQGGVAEAEWVALFSVDGSLLRQSSSMWEGFADVQVRVQSFRKSKSDWVSADSFTPSGSVCRCVGGVTTR